MDQPPLAEDFSDKNSNENPEPQPEIKSAEAKEPSAFGKLFRYLKQNLHISFAIVYVFISIALVYYFYPSLADENVQTVKELIDKKSEKDKIEIVKKLSRGENVNIPGTFGFTYYNLIANSVVTEKSSEETGTGNSPKESYSIYQTPFKSLIQIGDTLLYHYDVTEKTWKPIAFQQDLKQKLRIRKLIDYDEIQFYFLVLDENGDKQILHIDKKNKARGLYMGKKTLQTFSAYNSQIFTDEYSYYIRNPSSSHYSYFFLSEDKNNSKDTNDFVLSEGGDNYGEKHYFDYENDIFEYVVKSLNGTEYSYRSSLDSVYIYTQLFRDSKYDFDHTGYGYYTPMFTRTKDEIRDSVEFKPAENGNHPAVYGFNSRGNTLYYYNIGKWPGDTVHQKFPVGDNFPNSPVFYSGGNNLMAANLYETDYQQKLKHIWKIRKDSTTEIDLDEKAGKGYTGKRTIFSDGKFYHYCEKEDSGKVIIIGDTVKVLSLKKIFPEKNTELVLVEGKVFLMEMIGNHLAVCMSELRDDGTVSSEYLLSQHINWGKNPFTVEYRHNPISILLISAMFVLLFFVIFLSLRDLSKKDGKTRELPSDTYLPSLQRKYYEARRRSRELRKTSQLMLTFGLVVAVLGISIYVIMLNEQIEQIRIMSNQLGWQEWLLVGRATVLFGFIETISFFLLRQYRVQFNEFKEFYAICLNIQRIFHLIELAVKKNDMDEKTYEELQKIIAADIYSFKKVETDNNVERMQNNNMMQEFKSVIGDIVSKNNPVKK